MKVCILSHHFPPLQGGSEIYLGNLTDGLTKLGMDVVVITVRFDPSLPPYEEHKNLRIHRIPVPFSPIFKGYGFMLSLMPVLREIYENERFDLIHSEHPFSVLAAGKFAKEKGIPHVAVIESLPRISIFSKLAYLTIRAFFPRSHFDVVVPWNRFISEEFLKKWGIDESKIRVIPGGIDIEKFNPFVDGSQLRKKFADSEAQKLLFAAKPMYKTNALALAYVIKAMKEVVANYENCKLIIGGDGRKRKDLERLSRDLGLQERVEFIGWVSQGEIQEYYTAADILVTPLAYKHGSIAVLESLASGKPNVLWNMECLPGENGFPSSDIAMLVKPRDEEDLARGIIELLEDDALGEKIGTNAWNFVKENFSMDKIALRYKELYEELLE